MPEKKKKIIIEASIAGIVLLLVILIVVISSNQKAEDTEILEDVDLSELINVENIESLSYKTEETKEPISSKYIVGKGTCEVKANV